MIVPTTLFSCLQVSSSAVGFLWALLEGVRRHCREVTDLTVIVARRFHACLFLGWQVGLQDLAAVPRLHPGMTLGNVRVADSRLLYAHHLLVII